MAIGEAGSLITAQGLITINLTEPLDDPVIVFTTSVNGDPFVINIYDRLLNAEGQTIGFRFYIEEWEYTDGLHPELEVINWLAVEKGVHTLSDGRIIEAGEGVAGNTYETVNFDADFTQAPVVVSSVFANSNVITVDSHLANITSDSFSLRVQEEQGQDNIHSPETIGWIAIEPGSDSNGAAGTAVVFKNATEDPATFFTGVSYNDPVFIADAQTSNDPDNSVVNIVNATNTSVQFQITEEQSADLEMDHGNEDVGIVAFEAGVLQCFCHGARIETAQGPRPIEELRAGDRILSYDQASGCKISGKIKTVPLLRVFRRKIGRNALEASPNLFPVKISQGALGNDLPKRDLWVSRQHRMLVSNRIVERMFDCGEVLLPAIKLVGLPGIEVDEDLQEVEYFHLLFDQHRIIWSEGAPSESLYTGQFALQNMAPEIREEILQIFPECADENHIPEKARFEPDGMRQKKLAERIRKNQKPVISSEYVEAWAASPFEIYTVASSKSQRRLAELKSQGGALQWAEPKCRAG